jgi:DNA mismatch repair ATPase MutS
MPTEKPMMAQYRRLKEQNPGYILFFRLGGFYEMFNHDAYTAKMVLNLTVTARDSGDNVMIPQCGIPVKAAEKHAKVLIELGYRVAICDQLEGETENGIVKREVSRLFDPEPHILAAAAFDNAAYAVYLIGFEAQTIIALAERRARPKAPAKPAEVTGSRPSAGETHPIIRELRGMDMNEINPSTAWQILNNWKGTYAKSD